MSSEQQKWDRIYADTAAGMPAAATVLEQNQHLLPQSGTALDLACGRGGNSLLLARHGLSVRSWDISPVAIASLQALAERHALAIRAQVRDVVALPPEPDSFDVLVVSHFLERKITAQLMAALRPGGVLFYQTYCRDRVNDQGPSNPDFLLADNELLQLFAGLKVRMYREEALLGQQQQGWRNRAMLVAQKAFS